MIILLILMFSFLDNLIFNEGVELFGVMGFPDPDEFDPSTSASTEDGDLG